ncbi:MAG: hypothetical protein E7267_04190 [Lachnospiraceae bacterium]|nr:hypothetical protein [Lachnospiraceae bacterium]
MKKNIKRITACTLAGVIVAGSCGNYGQVEAKKPDKKSVESSTLDHDDEETSYVIDCKNAFIYNMINKNYAEDINEDTYLQDNNIVSLELTESEVENIESAGVVVEEDICVTGSGKKTDRLTKNKQRMKTKNTYRNTKKTKKHTLSWNVESLGITEEILQKDDRAEVSESIERVKIAILDSGIDYSENINVVSRKNFLDDEVSPLFEDNTGHGTAIAGIIASRGVDDTIKGINPNVEIYSARVLDENNQAPISRVVEAIYWAIDNEVNIINISFGTTQKSEVLYNAIRDAYKAGILIFAASGNQGEMQTEKNELDESYVEYPAAFSEVVAVGATTPSGEMSEITSRGDELELLAPGESIESVGWLDMGVVCDGTSMAVPHAVGAASLLWQKDLKKPAGFIKGLLEASAKTIDSDGKEYSFIDVDYANEIYNDYYIQYKKTEYSYNASDIDTINEKFDNCEEVEDYTDCVDASWSKDNHSKTVDYAYNNTGGCITASQVEIVKLGAKAPDIKWPASSDEKRRMFHAKDSDAGKTYNYIKVYEHIMNMALKCKKTTHAKALKIAYPDNNAGEYNECKTVTNTLNKDAIDSILKGKSINHTNEALVMLGIAMHLAADVYAHQSYVKKGDSKTFKIPGKYKKDHDQDGTPNNDDVDFVPARWKCAKETCKEIIWVWGCNLIPDGNEFNFYGYHDVLKLYKLYKFANESPNGGNKNEYINELKYCSYDD